MILLLFLHLWLLQAPGIWNIKNIDAWNLNIMTISRSVWHFPFFKLIGFWKAWLRFCRCHFQRKLSSFWFKFHLFLSIPMATLAQIIWFLQWYYIKSITKYYWVNCVYLFMDLLVTLYLSWRRHCDKTVCSWYIFYGARQQCTRQKTTKCKCFLFKYWDCPIHGLDTDEISTWRWNTKIYFSIY